MSDLVELVYQQLQNELQDLRRQVDSARRVERAEIADGIPAYTVANLPTIANGGLGNGSSYITLAFASNGRKTGEGVGAGTGVLCYYQASLNQWLRVEDNAQVAA